jgi:transcriptional regulator with XRE-family HTH domain
MTIEEVAERLDVSEVTVYSWLSGERFPSTANFKNIAEFIGADELELLEEWQNWQKRKLKAKKEWAEWERKHPSFEEE